MLDVRVDHKCYTPGSVVIEALDFSVHAGELVALVGPSGAGKSTLLNLISGLDSCFRGNVRLFNREAAMNRGRISMMFQDPRLMPWLTVWENVLLVEAQSQSSLARAEELLEAVGMKECRHLFPAQLSGGMKKRVALARAFLPQPDLLLMDEPFASLDAPTARQMRQLVQELCRRHDTTLLYVTHNLAEAVELADRLLFFSASPMRVIHDEYLDGWKPRDDPAAVEDFCRQLLNRHPQLLQGIN